VNLGISISWVSNRLAVEPIIDVTVKPEANSSVPQFDDRVSHGVFSSYVPSIRNKVLRCVTGEDKVAIFGRLVTREAGFVLRLVGGFAVRKVCKPPAAGRGVLF